MVSNWIRPKKRRPSHKRVETLLENSWTTLDDFPFVENHIYAYSFATFQNDLYIFGGIGDGYNLNLAAKYDGTWTQIGELAKPRSDHRSITISNGIVHIGGTETQ